MCVAQLEMNMDPTETPVAVQRMSFALSGYRRKTSITPAGRMYCKASAVVPTEEMAAMEEP